MDWRGEKKFGLPSPNIVGIGRVPYFQFSAKRGVARGARAPPAIRRLVEV
jgi:hypothetical protein